MKAFKVNSCLWNAQGIFGFDISVPGSQVLCYPCGCKDFEPRLTEADYKGDHCLNEALPYCNALDLSAFIEGCEVICEVHSGHDRP